MQRNRQAEEQIGQIKMIVLIMIFILVFPIAQADAVECFYNSIPTKENPYGELSPQGVCGELIDEDTLKLRDSHFKRLMFFQNGLAAIIVIKPSPHKAYYVSKDGRVTRTHYYDNGADYFEEGLARTISKGKFGYINEKLAVVIPPEYDFAFPFENGHAIVCIECKVKQVGEYGELVGGKWGLINSDGKVTIPIIFRKDELNKKKEFKAIYSHSL